MAFDILTNRIEREQRTFAHMLGIYCRAHHHPAGRLCPECLELLHQVCKRLTKCPFGVDKPACGDCPHNCQAPDTRDRLRRIMRFSGPRMLWRHPLLALLHLYDSRRHAAG